MLISFRIGLMTTLITLASMPIRAIALPSDITTSSADRGASPALEWRNARPEQKAALDLFYRSIQSQTRGAATSADHQLARQQHLEQLRGMSPEQRGLMIRQMLQKPQ